MAKTALILEDMRGHLGIYLLAVAVAAASFSASAAADGYISPVCVLPDSKVPKITDDNGHKVLESLYKTAWVQFTACVESGKAAWIDAALTLHPFSDGAVAEDIDSSLGEALGSNPERVLESAVKAGAAWELEAICAGVDFDDQRFNSYALSMAEIARRQKALSRVKNQDYKSQVDTCKADLEQSKAYVTQYYDADKPSDDNESSPPSLGVLPPPPSTSSPPNRY